MAERATGKAKRATQRHAAVPARSDARRAGGAETAAAAVAASASAGDRLAELERERDALQSELDAARAQIAQLEQQRDQVVNRIDWIIDSLHSLLDDER